MGACVGGVLPTGLSIVVVFKNAVSLSACRLLADLASLLLFTLISRELGPAATGQYSYVFALGVFISIIAANGLDLPPSVLAGSLARVGVPLGATLIVYTTLDATSLNDWYVSLIGCVAYPLFGLLCGLVPHPRRSMLLARPVQAAHVGP
jgi:O-antigen/teichoic acid export membrane protein